MVCDLTPQLERGKPKLKKTLPMATTLLPKYPERFLFKFNKFDEICSMSSLPDQQSVDNIESFKRGFSMYDNHRPDFNKLHCYIFTSEDDGEFEVLCISYVLVSPKKVPTA
jgi:hypothetical protein